jgi:hypothetical protein
MNNLQERICYRRFHPGTFQNLHTITVSLLNPFNAFVAGFIVAQVWK